MSETIEVTGWNIPRLLSAFQAMEMTARHNMEKCYGVSNRQACKIVEEITGIKPKGKGRGGIEPEKWYPESAPDDPLQQYMWWLVNTGEQVDVEQTNKINAEVV